MVAAETDNVATDVAGAPWRGEGRKTKQAQNNPDTDAIHRFAFDGLDRFQQAK